MRVEIGDAALYLGGQAATSLGPMSWRKPLDQQIISLPVNWYGQPRMISKPRRASCYPSWLAPYFGPLSAQPSGGFFCHREGQRITRRDDGTIKRRGIHHHPQIGPPLVRQKFDNIPSSLPPR